MTSVERSEDATTIRPPDYEWEPQEKTSNGSPPSLGHDPESENAALRSRIEQLEEDNEKLKEIAAHRETGVRLLASRIEQLEEALNDSEEAHQKGCLVRISALEEALERIADENANPSIYPVSRWMRNVARAALSKDTQP